MTNGNGLKPEITGKVDLGHILQMVVLVITVAGALFGTYSAIEGQISSQGQIIATLQQNNVELNKRVQQTQDEQRQFIRDITQSLLKITDQLTDLRILVAGKTDGKR